MIYVCTHEQFPKYTLNANYQIIKVGDKGINIWDKVSFRHLRHIWYIWSNLDKFDIEDDTITIFQHRRFLAQWNIPENYDIVCPIWGPNSCPVGKQYIMCHDKESLELSKEIIDDDEYLRFLEHPIGGISFHNIFSLHVGDFQDYCQELFYILFEIEKRLPDWNNACFLGERIGGYLIEKYFYKKYIAQLIEI